MNPVEQLAAAGADRPYLRGLLTVATVAVVFGVTALKVGMARHRRGINPAVVTLCLFLLCYVITAALWVPAVESLSPATAHAARAVTRVLATLFALLTIVYVQHGRHSRARTVAGHVAVAAAVLLVLGVLVAALPEPVRGVRDAVDVVALTYFGVAAVAIATRLFSFATHVTNRATLTVGLRIVAAGFLFGAMYAAVTILRVVPRWVGLVERQRCPSDAVGPFLFCGLGFVLAMVTLLVISVGVAVPVVATAWELLRRRWWQYRAHQRLGPLWCAVRDGLPQIVLSSTTALRGGPLPWEVEARLYRRWVEIRDGLLLLRPHRRGDADGLGEPVAQARSIAAALEAYQLRAPGSVPRPEPSTVVDDGHRHGHDYDVDVEWLAAVSDALSRLPARA